MKESLKKTPIHLRPRSEKKQRVWEINSHMTLPNKVGDFEIWLDVRPNSHGTFISLKAILGQLECLSSSELLRGDLLRIDEFLNAIAPENSESHSGHNRLLTDGVAFAIMRRISRESVYTAPIIDLAARTLNSVLSEIPGCEKVHVIHADRLDRPTLKVLARAMLLLEPKHNFTWIWHLKGDPISVQDEECDDMYLLSRNSILRGIMSVVCPTIHRKNINGTKLERAAVHPNLTAYDISAALVMQNYDACFLWHECLTNSVRATQVAEGYRLLALAAVNIGHTVKALSFLNLSESRVVGTARQAHICYLQGLVEAKRNYNLVKSNFHYERGLKVLEGIGDSEDDVSLERAWLLNGMALNLALQATHYSNRNGDLAKAFRLVHSAFQLVSDGDDPARTYLRYNLLANSAFLLEMQGKYDLAIDTFISAFDFENSIANIDRSRWLSTISYRIGILHFKARRLEMANTELLKAAQYNAKTENWAIQERILSALGIIALDRQNLSEAASFFTEGLSMCRSARSAKGTAAHGRGLIAALLLADFRSKAKEVSETLVSDEQLACFEMGDDPTESSETAVNLGAPSPKLPAYIPEIDLEDIPNIDLNKYLAETSSQRDGN